MLVVVGRSRFNFRRAATAVLRFEMSPEILPMFVHATGVKTFVAQLSARELEYSGIRGPVIGIERTMFQPPSDRAVGLGVTLSDSNTVTSEKFFHIESPAVRGRLLHRWRLCGLKFVR